MDAAGMIEALKGTAQAAIDQYMEINAITEDRDRALNLEKAFHKTEEKVNEFMGSTGDAIENFRA